MKKEGCLWLASQARRIIDCYRVKWIAGQNPTSELAVAGAVNDMQGDFQLLTTPILSLPTR
jgi:hypothetical protein